MLTCLGKFIPNLSRIASPLQNLFKNNVKWHWQAEQVNSFRSLKELITTALQSHQVISSKGLEAVLIQDNHPIAYASRALTRCQQHHA